MQKSAGGQFEIRIVAGVEATNSTEASFRMFNSTSPENWIDAPLPVSGHRIRSCQPVNLQAPLRQGYFYILKSDENQDPESGTCYFHGNQTPKQIFFGRDRKPISIATCVHEDK
jgi:hypothetical protein